jgi:metallo-beta-lactamase family protein
MHLVEACGRKILLDCGLVRGPHGHAHPPGPHFTFDPRDIDAVVISHAHIDHCGNLGMLIAQGFSGPIHATPATCDLLRLVLRTSARIQEEDAFVRRVIDSGSDREAQPPFTVDDVERGLAHAIAVPYQEPRQIAPGIQLLFADAGHILGSAMVSLTLEGSSRTARFTFTGDLGRKQPLLLRQPATVPAADLVLCESTYGGRSVESAATATAALYEIVRRTAEQGGKVLIPAFSLGRTQAVVDVLAQGVHEGLVPRIPILVDGSLAAELAEVHRCHAACLDPAAAERLQRGDGILESAVVHYLKSPEESAEASRRREPCVILAPSGMCEGGRIIRHLKENLDDPRCSIVLVNYQAPHTLGRRLLQRGPKVRIHGRSWNKWAEVVALTGFSGHADHDDLLAALSPLSADQPRIRLVHGEPEQAEALAAALMKVGFTDVAVPERGERVPI